MMRLFVPVALCIAALSLVLVGCQQAAPAPTAAPSRAPAVPAVAPAAPAAPAVGTAAPAAPTKAPATAQPTALPVKKVAYPEGKTITLIVNAAAGGPTDVGARLMATGLEKVLGTSIQIVNKPGAGTQIAVEELAKSKPDGYTIGTTNLPVTITLYKDPERERSFERKDLLPVANHVIEPFTMTVRADSPYQTVKDVFDAAKAGQRLKAGSHGPLSNMHINMILWEKVAGVSFVHVSFDGAAPMMTALLGGHIDLHTGTVGSVLPQLQGGEVRVLGVTDIERSEFLPAVKTFQEQGYKVEWGASRGYSVAAGTPKEIVDILSDAIGKVCQMPDQIDAMKKQGLVTRFMNSQEYSAYWNQLEVDVVVPIMEMVRTGQK